MFMVHGSYPVNSKIAIVTKRLTVVNTKMNKKAHLEKLLAPLIKQY